MHIEYKFLPYVVEQPRNPEDFEQVSVETITEQAIEIADIIYPEQLAEVIKEKFAAYSRGIETYTKYCLLNIPVQSRILRASKEHGEVDDDNTLPSDVATLRSFTNYVAALAPNEWRNACRLQGVQSRAYQAEPTNLATLWALDPLRMGMYTMRKPSFHVKRAEARIRKIVEPHPDTGSTITGLVKKIDVVSALLVRYAALDLMHHCKKVASPADAKRVKRVVKQFNDLEGEWVIVDFLTQSTNLAAEAAELGEVYGKKTSITPGIRSEIKKVSGDLIELICEVADNYKIYSGIFTERSELLRRADEEGKIEPGYVGDAIKDEEARARHRLAEEERAQKESNEQILHSELKQQIVRLNARKEQLQLPWSISSKSIKNRGLKDAVGALVRGINSESGVEVFVGRSKSEAYELVGDIEYLRILAETSSIDNFYEILESTHDKENELIGDIQQLVEAAGQLPHHLQSNILSNLPEVTVKSSRWDEIRNNWPKFAHLIKEYWPNGSTVAAILEGFLEKPERQEVTQKINGQAQDASTQPIALTQPENELRELLDDSSVLPREFLHDIAMQLDTIILPPEATLDDVKEAIEKLDIPQEQSSKIDWNRLYNLVKIRDDYEGVMYRSKKGSLGNAPPYFVVSFEYEGSQYAIAESPVAGNATYIVAEKLAAGTWLEVLSLPKSEARVLGAKRIIHRGPQLPERHREKIDTCLIDLMAVAA